MSDFGKIFIKKGGIMKKTNLFLIPMPMKLSLRILQWELPLIMLWAVAMLVSLLCDYPQDPIGASHTFIDCIEYIGAALVLSCITAILSDLILREQQNKKE